MSDTSTLLPRLEWDPDIHDGLCAMIAAHGRSSEHYRPDAPPIATFDWDNTVLRGDIGEAALIEYGKRLGRDLVAEYVGLHHTQGRKVSYEWCATVLEGQTSDDLIALATAVLDDALASGRIRYRSEMLSLIRAMEDSGWQVWVVSASLEELVRVSTARIGLPDDRVLGLRLARDPQGLALPEVIPPSPVDEGKAHVIDQLIGRRPIFAAGDSDNDLFMLRAAQHRLVIDRGQPVVRKEGLAGGWWIQSGWEIAALD